MGERGGEEEKAVEFVLVARKECFGLPTACPSCLPVYLYLRFANISFQLHYDRFSPDSDHIPYVELGDYVALNNENGGVIEGLKEDGIINLDSNISKQSMADWSSAKAMTCSWLADAATYELWVASDGSVADKIYFSDLPWAVKKALHWKKKKAVANHFGTTEANSIEKEKEIYRRAKFAYEALSLRLGEQKFFFENRPTSLDAIFLGHALFVLQTSDATSMLRSLLDKHSNLVKYAENLMSEFLGANSSSSIPRFPYEPSTSSTTRGQKSSRWRSNSEPKAKKEKTEEEKIFRQRGKYFLGAQFVAVLIFLTILGNSWNADLEMDGDDDYN